MQIISSNQRQANTSPFLQKCIKTIESGTPLLSLDIPCGFGRHSIWLATRGHQVVSADIDAKRIAAFQPGLALMMPDRSEAVILDALQPLPFSENAFDLVVIVDFVAPELIEQIDRYVRPGGWLAYETFSARGENWRELPERGRTADILARSFSKLIMRTKCCGPENDRETVKYFGRKFPSP